MGFAVLVADANRELRELYRRFLSRHGWQVQTAEGGLECLAYLRQSPPQL
jgi:CheY-like chemotaxis protein